MDRYGYTAVVDMVQEGMYEEALTVIRAIRDRLGERLALDAMVQQLGIDRKRRIAGIRLKIRFLTIAAKLLTIQTHKTKASWKRFQGAFSRYVQRAGWTGLGLVIRVR